MTKSKKNRLQEISSLVLGKPGFLNMKTSELKKNINEISHSLDLEWIKSGYKDFSLYHRFDYLYSVLNCYYTISANSVKNSMKYFKNNNVDISKLEAFDDYNGLGITTLDLIESGFKSVSYFNDVDIQLEAFNKILDFYNLEKPLLDKDKSGKYDVVFSMEIAEHEQNPDEYLDSICSMVKDDGYLCISITFNNKYLGHFNEYFVNGKTFNPPRGAGAAALKRIADNGFERVCVGFNGKPFVFKKM